MPAVAAGADRSNPSQARVVLAAYNASMHQGTIYFVENGQINPIFSDHYVLSFPTFSPDGGKIAFNRRVAETVADGDIVVIDLSGRVLSNLLLNKVKPGVTAAAMQGVESIAWMGNNRIAVTGNANSAVGLGFMLQLRPSSLQDPANDGSDPKDAWFEDDGPSSISPSGTHIVTITGLSQSYPYTSCAGDERDAAEETIDIDGIDMPVASLKKFVVVAPFSWEGDTRFSTVVRYNKGLAILTAYGIPSKIETVPRPANAPEGTGPRVKAENPPSFAVTPLPINASEIPSAVFEGHYDQQGQYWLYQYVDSHPKVVSTWKLAQGYLVRANTIDTSTDLADSERAKAMGRAISGDTRQLTDKIHLKVSDISSENVWCRRIGCGALAFIPAKNAVATPISAVAVPDVCTEQ